MRESEFEIDGIKMTVTGENQVIVNWDVNIDEMDDLMRIDDDDDEDEEKVDEVENI